MLPSFVDLIIIPECYEPDLILPVRHCVDEIFRSLPDRIHPVRIIIEHTS